MLTRFMSGGVAEAKAATSPSGQAAKATKHEASAINGKPRDPNTKLRDAKPQDAVAAPAPIKPQASASPGTEPVAQAVAFLKAGFSAVAPTGQ